MPGKIIKKRINPGDLQIQDVHVSFKFIVIALVVLFIILIFLSILLVMNRNDNVVLGGGNEAEKVDSSFFSSDGSTRVEMRLPAVDADGNGVSTTLKVEASPGSGRTLTDIDNLLFWADTQHSIRIARRVAEGITGKKTEDYDLVYTIEANASVIGGPSAGAALVIATIAALDGKNPKDNVMITGSINHDGSIGPVSAILEKAKAAKDIGADLFLVPLLQSRDVVYDTTEHCEVFGGSEVCTTETRPRRIDIEQESGITIKEIASVEEAMGYFFE